MPHRDLRSIIRTLVGIAIVWIAHAPGAAAQAIPVDVEPANPSALEVHWAAPDDRPVTFDVELFPAAIAQSGSQPIRVSNRRLGSTLDARTTKVDILDMFDGLPDGEYIATLHIVSLDGARVGSATSDRFTVSGYRSPTVAAERENQRLWTRVAIAIAGALLLIPLVLR